MRIRSTTDSALRSAGIVGLLVIAGCAAPPSIAPQPFESFQQSVVQLRVSADAALLIEQDIVYERQLQSWIAEGSLDALLLEASAPPDPLNPFDLRMSGSSLYGEMQEARGNLDRLNSLVQDYATTLHLLTGSSEDSPNVDADALAGDLQTKAAGLAATLNLDVEVPGGFFFGFGELAKRYVENKRQSLLIELIRASQDEIELFAQLGQQICRLSAAGIDREYKGRFSAATADAAGLSGAERRVLIESILALNEETLRQMSTLKLVNDAYGSLPAAHRGLERTIAGGSSPSFVELLSYAEILKKRYDKFNEE